MGDLDAFPGNACGSTVATLKDTGFSGGSDLFVRYTLRRELSDSRAVQLFRSGPGDTAFVVTGTLDRADDDDDGISLTVEDDTRMRTTTGVAPRTRKLSPRSGAVVLSATRVGDFTRRMVPPPSLTPTDTHQLGPHSAPADADSVRGWSHASPSRNVRDALAFQLSRNVMEREERDLTFREREQSPPLHSPGTLLTFRESPPPGSTDTSGKHRAAIQGPHDRVPPCGCQLRLPFSASACLARTQRTGDYQWLRRSATDSHFRAQEE